VGEGLCCWNAKGIYIYIYRYCGPGIVDFIPVELDVQPRSDLPGSGLVPANPCPCIYTQDGQAAWPISCEDETSGQANDQGETTLDGPQTSSQIDTFANPLI